MSRPDPHDPRKFLHYAQIAPDGHVLATVEAAESYGVPSDGVNAYVDVTALFPYDFSGVQMPKATANPTAFLRVANRVKAIANGR